MTEKDARETPEKESLNNRALSRREFLRYAGLTGAVIGVGGGLGGLLAACGGGTTTTTAGATTTAGPTTTAAGGATTTTAAGATTTVAAGGTPFKLGVTAPYTGINSAAWSGTYIGLKLELEHQNAAGGINGRTIELVELDTKSDPVTAANNATQLSTNEEIDACFMTYPPEEIAAIFPVVEKYGMPSVTAASPLNMQANLYKGKWLFYVMAHGAVWAQATLNEIKAQGWKSVIGIADGILLDIEILDELKPIASAAGVTANILPDQVSLAETDLTPYCNKIYAEWKKNPSDAVLYMGAMIQFPQMYTGLRGLGLTAPIVGGPVTAHVATFAMGPEAVEGALVVGNAATNAPGLPDGYPNKAQMVEYHNELMAKNKAPLDMWGAQAIDALRVIWEGLKVGGDDRAKTRDAMEALKNFPSMQGSTLSYAPGDHNGVKSGDVTWELKGGQFAFVRALD
ncbi:MAG: ABC transporter substrate-binding protein [Actinobacteria bacterium]|nr:ABC transporter substrate-binding protein [Actinomycetota bacterium]